MKNIWQHGILFIYLKNLDTLQQLYCHQINLSSLIVFIELCPVGKKMQATEKWSTVRFKRQMSKHFKNVANNLFAVPTLNKLDFSSDGSKKKDSPSSEMVLLEGSKMVVSLASIPPPLEQNLQFFFPMLYTFSNNKNKLLYKCHQTVALCTRKLYVLIRLENRDWMLVAQALSLRAFKIRVVKKNCENIKYLNCAFKSSRCPVTIEGDFFRVRQ